jgi:hypothetical protein
MTLLPLNSKRAKFMKGRGYERSKLVGSAQTGVDPSTVEIVGNRTTTNGEKNE